MWLKMNIRTIALFILLLFLLTSNFYAQNVTFTNVADEVGISFSRLSDFFGGGVTFCDFNNDGMEDLTFSSGSGELLKIFQNNGISFDEVESLLGVDDLSNVQTALWADYDNDGDKDLFLSCRGEPERLYNNDGGFLTDVTASAGISDQVTQSTAAAWADYNNDGLIDIYIGIRNDTKPNVLYKNNGDGTFSDVTLAAGVADTMVGISPYKLPLALSFLDFNNDGWEDIYIANDKLYGNTLFKNNGDGTFDDVSADSHTDIYFDAMGVAVGDYNNDGFFDIYVSNSPAGNALLKNNGDGTFSNVANQLGLEVNKICWGVNFIDIDNDTDLDLFVSSLAGSTGLNDPQRENALFENLGDGTFNELHLDGINTDTSKSYGNAIGDFNNDGYSDIAVLNASPTFSALWKNSGFTNNWIKIKLEGVISNRDGVGSVITVYNNGENFMRPVLCGNSYLSQSSLIQTIGIGSSIKVDSVKIKWPSGLTDVIYNVDANKFYKVIENQSVTDVQDKRITPVEFQLFQNYPNPFNPSTKIKYEIPFAETSLMKIVQLKVYDVLGNEVATLVNEEKSPGTYDVEFNAGNLTSGIYYYQLRAGNIVQTKKMILLR